MACSRHGGYGFPRGIPPDATPTRRTINSLYPPKASRQSRPRRGPGELALYLLKLITGKSGNNPVAQHLN
jgi:hypothetical protein